MHKNFVNKFYFKKYRRIREMSEEKLAIAEFLELMLDKYQERIAKDLNEFKIELEADTPNITETIEKGIYFFCIFLIFYIVRIM